MAVAPVSGDAVAEDGPALGGGDGECEDGLEVGLVERGEDALDVFHEELGVDVGLAVGRVGEAVHAFAGAGVAHGGVDAQFVGAGGERGEGEAVLDEVGGVEGMSVEADRAQSGRLELDEGVSGRGGGELDDGAGVEGLLPVVRSRSIEYRCTSRNLARVCASSRVSTDMCPCCRTRWTARSRVLARLSGLPPGRVVSPGRRGNSGTRRA